MKGIGRLQSLQNLAEGSVSGVPLVEIMGDGRVLIEHHRGVVAYGCEEIRVRVCYGAVSISGRNLYLARMTGEQIVICGTIEAVQLLRHPEGRNHGRKNRL